MNTYKIHGIMTQEGKAMKIIIVCSLIAVMLCVYLLTLTGCSDSTPDAIKDNFTNLAKGGSFDKTSGGQGDSVVFDFGKDVTLNTLVLKEKSGSVTSFSLYADDSVEAFYGNDFIDGYRYCAFDEITLSSVRIEVLQCDGEWEIDDLEAYDVKSTDKDDNFRIMSYLTVDSALYLGEEYAQKFSAVTQFNVFGTLYLDKEGNIVFQDYEKDGETIDGKQALNYALQLVRKYNPEAKIVATILGNKDFYQDGMDAEQRHTAAMGDNKDKLISNVLKVIEEFSFDGISFDYEYPYKLKSYSVYKSFLKDLDEALPEGKLLTAAISDWQLGIKMFTKNDLKVLDQIEVMAYDSFDERGNHSTFYKSCYDILEKFRSKGVDMSKINLGIPFYSRPVDGATFWGNYKDVADKILPWENSYTQPYTDLDGKEYPPLSNYYNGIQIVKDKTCYAVDSGVGGVMIWHFACDSSDPELSLIQTMAKAVQSRK